MVAGGESLGTALLIGPRRDAKHRHCRGRPRCGPVPARGFHRGDYHRLRVGRFRVVYVIDGDVIIVERVGRIS